MNPSSSLLAALASPTGEHLLMAGIVVFGVGLLAMMVGPWIFIDARVLVAALAGVLIIAGVVLVGVGSAQQSDYAQRVDREVLAAVRSAGVSPTGQISTSVAPTGHTLWSVPVIDSDSTLHVFIVDRDVDGTVTLRLANYQRP